MKRSLLIAALFAIAAGSWAAADKAAAKAAAKGAPEVYFSREISPAKLRALYDRLGFAPKAPLGVKVHFGEPGNPNIMKPALVKDLVLALKGTLVETNTIYGDNRSRTADHLRTAKKHGWGFAPLDILDSSGETPLPYKGKYFDRLPVGRNMSKYGSFLVVSHFKGHGMAGFGGALKNLSMGFASPLGKRMMHAGHIPKVRNSKCVRCGICRQVCPVDAISEDYVIDRRKCIGCGKCVASCPYGAIDSDLEVTGGLSFQEKMAEFAHGVAAASRFAYVNLAMDISSACDCVAGAPAPFMGDVGILASLDPVALDQASFDLVNKAAGIPDAFKHQTGVSGLRIIERSAELGLGSRKYKLVEIK